MNDANDSLPYRFLGTLLKYPAAARYGWQLLGTYWRAPWPDADSLAVADAIQAILARGHLPDPITVADEIPPDRPAANSLPALLALAESELVIPQRADQLLDRALRAELSLRTNALAQRLEADAETNPRELAMAHLGHLADIAASGIKETPIADIVDRRIEEYYAIKAGTRHNSLPLGHPVLDHHLGGGMPLSKTTIVAARLSQGKTTLASNIMAIALDTGTPVVDFSFDDDEDFACHRMACIISGVSSLHAQGSRLNRATEERYMNALRWLKEAPFVVITDPTLSPLQCRAKLYEYCHVRWPGRNPLVVVDYIQQQGRAVEDAAKMTRTMQVATASGQWKRTFESLPVYGLLLAQLNRDAANAQPAMHNIADADDIGRDAYATILLWYKGQADPAKPANQIEAILAKHKGGARTTAIYHFSGYDYRMSPWQDDDEELNANEMRDATRKATDHQTGN